MKPEHRDPRVGCLTFDLDTLALDLFDGAVPTCAVKEQLEDISYERILPRILNFLDDIYIRSTFFVIGRHATRYPHRIQEIVERGHEVANHTLNHHKSFSLLTRDEISKEVGECHKILATISGIEPKGFRAPGYTINSQVLSVLREMNYAYDASLVPSWFYTFIKRFYTSVLRGAYRNYSIPQEFRCALAPKRPYSPDPRRPFATKRGEPLLEIPISVTPMFQLPFINGIKVRMGPAVSRLMERSLLKRSFFSFGLHDFEFATSEDLDGLPVAAGFFTKPHLRLPLHVRLDLVRQTVEGAKRTHQFLLMREVPKLYQ
jgi:peptidoglycan-N-acetylglucosamine deacetylase